MLFFIICTLLVIFVPMVLNDVIEYLQWWANSNDEDENTIENVVDVEFKEL